MIYETAKNIKENFDRLIGDHCTDSLNYQALGKCGGRVSGSGGCHILECHNTTGSDYNQAAYVQADVYNVVDSIESENQRHKSDIGSHSGTRVDATAATAAHNVLVHYFDPQQHRILATRHFKSLYQTGLQKQPESKLALKQQRTSLRHAGTIACTPIGSILAELPSQ